MEFFTEIEKNYLKNPLEPQKTQIAKAIMRKNNARGITLPNCKIYYKVIVNRDTQTNETVQRTQKYIHNY